MLPALSALMALESALVVGARARLAAAQHRGDTGRATAALALAGGAGAALELMLTPALCAWSDRAGRRKALLLCAYGTALTRLVVFVAPGSKRALRVDRAVSMLLSTALLACVRAAQADAEPSAAALALAAGRTARYVALALFFAPYAEALAARAGGSASARTPFLLSALLCLGAGAWAQRDLPESNGEARAGAGARSADKPWSLLAASPLGFLRLLGSGSTVASLCGVAFLQSLGEPRNAVEVQTRFMREHLGWSETRAGNLLAAGGLAVVVSALAQPAALQAWGLRGSTEAGNLLAAAASALMALAPASAPWDVLATHASLALSVGALRRRDGVEAITARIAGQVGAGGGGATGSMGNGELAAALAAWRSLAALAAPLVLGNALAWGTRDGRDMPGAPFWGLAAASLLAHSTFAALSDKELGLLPASKAQQAAPALKPQQHQQHQQQPEPQQHQQHQQQLVIGSVLPARDPALQPGATFLNKERQRVRLAAKVTLSHNTQLLRFALPERNAVLGLPVGKHVKVFVPNRGAAPTTPGLWNGREDKEVAQVELERKYTPTSLDADLGVMDLVVKAYRPSPPRFPDGGRVSQFLCAMQPGDWLDVQGPVGLVEYLGRGRFALRRKERAINSVGMLAGGSGITPMLQLLRCVLDDPLDETQLSLVYANQTEEDILLKDVLDYLAAKHPTRFRVHYTVDRPGPSWRGSTGYFSHDILLQRMPPPDRPDSAVLVCGPPSMLTRCKPILDALGFPPEAQIEY
jgi:cytochrome-b5 reductase